MKFSLGTRLFYRQENGEALVEVISTEPITLQSGKVLNHCLRLRVIKVQKEFWDLPLQVGHELVIYDVNELNARWRLEAIAERPAEQIGLGLFMALPD